MNESGAIIADAVRGKGWMVSFAAWEGNPSSLAVMPAIVGDS
jgi:hypothetical protein